MIETFQADVAIVGAGGAGLRAAIAVAQAHPELRIALVEAFAPDSAAQPSFDERTTAATAAGVRVREVGSESGPTIERRSGVSTAPGFTLKPRIPWGRPSLAIERVKESSAALLAA